MSLSKSVKGWAMGPGLDDSDLESMVSLSSKSNILCQWAPSRSLDDIDHTEAEVVKSLTKAAWGLSTRQKEIVGHLMVL